MKLSYEKPKKIEIQPRPAPASSDWREEYRNRIVQSLQKINPKVFQK